MILGSSRRSFFGALIAPFLIPLFTPLRKIFAAKETVDAAIRREVLELAATLKPVDYCRWTMGDSVYESALALDQATYPNSSLQERQIRITGNYDLVSKTYTPPCRYRALVLRRNAEDLKEWIDDAGQSYLRLGAQVTESNGAVLVKFQNGARAYADHIERDGVFERLEGLTFSEASITRHTNLKLLAATRVVGMVAFYDS